MGWYGRDNVKKYYNIGFCEEELQKLNIALEKQQESNPSEYFAKHTRFIKHLALTCLDLKQENERLRCTLANTQRKTQAFAEAQADAIGQDGASEETTWTGYYHGIKKTGNIIFPVWG